MILHCTKKVFAKLPTQAKQSQQILSAIGMQAQWLNWHANIITIQRRQCLIAVHDVTRFSLFIPCLVKKDWADLNWHFEDAFITTLLKSDIEPELINIATDNLQPLQFDTVCDRSVQGTMNQIAQEVDFGFYHNRSDITDINHYQISADLSERPCNVKGQKDCISHSKQWQNF